MIIPNSCIPFIALQRTNYIDIKRDYEADLKNEFNSMIEFLPCDCESIIDIGCGIAGIDILLSQYYNNNPLLFLIDRNEKPDKIIYGFSKKTSFYNSFDAVKEIMNQNNIKQYTIIDVQHTEATPRGIDIIISLLACGFHFHINTYLKFILNHLNDNGILILDIRKTKKEQIDILKNHFSDIQEIETTNPKTIRICAKGRI